MSVHVLQINLDIQHAAALASINNIGGAVTNVLNQVQQLEQAVPRAFSSLSTAVNQFSSINTSVAGIASSVSQIGGAQQQLINVNQGVTSLTAAVNQLGIATQNLSLPPIVDQAAIQLLSEADAITKRLADNTSATDYSGFLADTERLSDISNTLQTQFKGIAGISERIALIEGRRIDAYNRLHGFMNDVAKSNNRISKQVDDLLHSHKQITFETKTQLKNFKQYVDLLRQADKLGINSQQLGLATNKNLKEIIDHADELLENTKEQESLWKKVDGWINQFRKGLIDSNRVFPGVGQFAKLYSIGEMIGGMFTELNKVYDENRTVDKLRMKQVQQGLDLDEAFYKSVLETAKAHGILTGEAQKAITALANAGVMVTSTGEDFMAAAQAVATMSLATGISNEELAGFVASMQGAGVTMKQTTKIMDDLVEFQAQFGLSTKTTANMVQFLNKNAALMRGRFQDVDSGARRLNTSLALLAGSARKLGLDANDAMAVFQKAFEDPLEHVLILGEAINSTNPAEQFHIMSRNAAELAASLKGASPIARKAILDAYGLTEAQLQSLAGSYDTYFKQHEALIDSITDEAEKAKALDKIYAQYEDQQKASVLASEARENATRKLTEAFDDLKILFYELLKPMIGILKMMAEFAANPIGQWVVGITAGIVLLYGAIRTLMIVAGTAKAVIGGLGMVIGKLGGSIASVTGGAGAAGAASLKQTGEGLVGFINAFKTISLSAVLKAAATVAILGVSLGVGLAAIGLAANLLPPDKVMPLLVSLGGLLGAMFILSMMSSVGPQALIGAIVVGAVGLGLGLGIAAIGLALNLMPEDKMTELLVSVGVLLAAMGLLALMAPIGVPALIGSLLLFAMSIPLAGAIAMLGLGLRSLPDDSIQQAEALLKTVGALALMGPAAVSAAAGAALLMGAAIALVPAAILLSLASSFDVWQEFPAKLSGFVDTLGGITPDKVQALKDLAGGVLEFAKSMGDVVAGGFFGLFTGDITDKAEAMAESIAMLTGIAGLPLAGKAINQLGLGVKSFAEGLNMIEQSGGSIDKLKRMLVEAQKIGAKQAAAGSIEVLNRTVHSIDSNKQRDKDQKQQEVLDKVVTVLEEIRDSVKDKSDIKTIVAALDFYLPELADNPGRSSASNQYTS